MRIFSRGFAFVELAYSFTTSEIVDGIGGLLAIAVSMALGARVIHERRSEMYSFFVCLRRRTFCTKSGSNESRSNETETAESLRLIKEMEYKLFDLLWQCESVI